MLYTTNGQYVKRKAAVGRRMTTVLIVEDNERNMRLMRLLLRPLGYHLLEATDGKEALAMLEGATPDIILVDIQLPDVDGLEITRRLRQQERFATTPIVALTAYAMPGDREMFLRAGCTGYVAKPIDTRAFPEIIASYLHERDAASSSEGALPE
jgi:two-component system, cell cycle response regulator DivK